MTNPTVRKYKIDGMHCVSCAMLIEGELEDAKVGDEAICKYATSELTVKSQNEISDTKIIETIDKLGYKATPIKC
jgi:Cd2+/Zn2+-exporting ATPase